MTTIALPKRNQNKYETDWSRWARNLATDGIVYGELNNLEIEGFSGGMQVKVKAGTASMRGFYFHNPVEEAFFFEAADPSNPRIDSIVMRMDISANAIDSGDDPVQLAILQGSPAVTPVAPTLTQNDTVYDIVLAEINIASNATTIAASDVIDKRCYTNLEFFNIHFFVPLTETGISPTIIKIPKDCEIVNWTLLPPWNETGSCSLKLLQSTYPNWGTSNIELSTLNLVSAQKATGEGTSMLISSLTQEEYLIIDVLSFSTIESVNLILSCRKKK